MKESLKEFNRKVYSLATSRRGRNLMTFFVFVVISTIFWFIMALSNENIHEFEIPLTINDIPGDVTLLSDVPQKISVEAKDKGTNLLRWQWGNVPDLQLNFNEFQNNGKYISMNGTQLSGTIRSAFGGNINIIDIKPDSLYISYTNNPGVLKQVTGRWDISTSANHIISGPITLSTDSVRVFSQNALPKSSEVFTDSIILSGLTDTTTVEVALTSINGVKIIPSKITVCIPVEPLIVRKRSIPVEIINVPDTVRIITFPSSVEISYAVPMSIYNHDDANVTAIATYRPDLKKLPLSLSSLPSTYRNPVLASDSVEYLVEVR